MIKVSEIQIIPIKPKDGHVGFASCIINDAFYLGSIGIHTSIKNKGSYRITYPTKNVKRRDGFESRVDIFKPVNAEAGRIIEDAIIEKFETIFNREQ